METSSTAETERIKKRVAPKILKQCMLNLKKEFSVRQPEDELKSALLVSTIHSYFELLVLSVTLFYQNYVSNVIWPTATWMHLVVSGVLRVLMWNRKIKYSPENMTSDETAALCRIIKSRQLRKKPHLSSRRKRQAGLENGSGAKFRNSILQVSLRKHLSRSSDYILILKLLC